MNSVVRTTAALCFGFGAAALVGVVAITAEPASETPPSRYAPARDLLAQVEELREHAASDLEDEAAYSEYQQNRLRMDANTLAALALVLGKHDEKNAVQGNATQVIAAAKKLAGAVKDYKQAKAAQEELNAAFAKSGEAAELQWKPAADIAELMKQVPIVNSSLRRGVDGRRFERLADKNASYAATLAALAQASMADTDYCSDEEEEQKWRQYCTQLRDAAADVRRHVRAGDQDAAVKSLAMIGKSCDACHHAFGVE